MSKSKAIEDLARAGVYVEAPTVVVQDDQPSVDPIGTDKDFANTVADEAFMHEKVLIRIATTTDSNAPEGVTLCVNDISNKVMVPRGVPVLVKRCHVEVLARMRETKFVQPKRDFADPESGNTLIPRHAQVYPFEVLKDTDRGMAWYHRLMAEPTY